MQISIPISYRVCAAPTVPLVISTLDLGFIPAITVFAILIIGSVALGIVGAIKAAKRKHFDYRIFIK